jgi:hypothetical protein
MRSRRARRTERVTSAGSHPKQNYYFTTALLAALLLLSAACVLEELEMRSATRRCFTSAALLAVLLAA